MIRKKHSDVDRNTQFIYRFGITLDDYNSMHEEQEGACAICKQPEKLNRRLAVDHNHSTKNVRGLLCFKCNTMLGHIDKNHGISMVASILIYLDKEKENG